MSRRHTSTNYASTAMRVLAATLGLALVVTAVVPAVASAQGRANLEQNWEVLTYRTDSGEQEPVLNGVGATVLFFGGISVQGAAACSDYEARYERVGNENLFIQDIEPAYVDCDVKSREFDERFYRHLSDTASFRINGSVLRLYDDNDLERPLLVLTNATIDDDPTVARWNVARIGGADGSVEQVIQGPEPWIEFLPGGSVVGSGACGSFLGSYTTRTGTMDISDVRYRLRDCNESALDQAQRIVETLAEISNFEVRPAGLVLQDENRTRRLALEPDIRLNRRTWTPTVIYGADGRATYQGPQLETSAVKFDGPDAEGVTTCRPFRTTALRSGLALSVDPDFDFYDPRPCPKKRGNVDYQGIHKAFMTGLEQTASHALRGSELELKDVEGRTLMRLEPQADLLDQTWVVTQLGRKKPKPPVGSIPITVTFSESTGLVSGDTGAGTAGAEPNSYTEFYTLEEAGRIKIDPIGTDDVFGRACIKGKKRKNTPACKQELQFLELLSAVDGYIPKPDVLQLRIGSRTVMRLIPDFLYDAQNAGDIE